MKKLLKPKNLAKEWLVYETDDGIAIQCGSATYHVTPNASNTALHFFMLQDILSHAPADIAAWKQEQRTKTLEKE